MTDASGRDRQNLDAGGDLNRHDGSSGSEAEKGAPDQPNAPDLSNREYELLRHYTDPTSPGFCNGTKSAELARYRGLPGSNQLAVQATRTLKRARKCGELKQILDEKGCTLEHATERLNACLDAKRRRLFAYLGEVIEGPLEDDFGHQLAAAKIVIGLHCSLDRQGAAHVATTAAMPTTDREPVSSEQKEAIAIIRTANPVDRDALRDVLECDEKLREFEVKDGQSAHAPKAGDGRPERSPETA